MFLENFSEGEIGYSGLRTYGSSSTYTGEGYSLRGLESEALEALENRTNGSSGLYRLPQGLEAGDVRGSEIMISGGPFRECSYRTKAFVDAEKGLEVAYLDAGFATYRYQGIEISTSVGENLSCGIGSRGDTCVVSTDFNIGNDSFKLSPGEIRRPDNILVEKVELVNATKTWKRRVSWMSDTRSTYIVHFSAESPEPRNSESGKSSRPAIDSLVKKFFSAVVSLFG
jgi:hypothetical protein